MAVELRAELQEAITAKVGGVTLVDNGLLSNACLYDIHCPSINGGCYTYLELLQNFSDVSDVVLFRRHVMERALPVLLSQRAIGSDRLTLKMLMSVYKDAELEWGKALGLVRLRIHGSEWTDGAVETIPLVNAPALVVHAAFAREIVRLREAYLQELSTEK